MSCLHKFTHVLLLSLITLCLVTEKGTAEMELKSPQKCTSAQFSSCGSFCGTGYEDGVLRLFDTASANVRWTVARSTTSIVGVAFNFNASMILAVGR